MGACCSAEQESARGGGRTKYLSEKANAFEDLGELGSGQFGSVHEVRKDGKTYAMKVIVKDGSTPDSEVREEANILESLNHVNIIGYEDFFEDADNFYLVTEIMRGGELFDRIVSLVSYTEEDARDAMALILKAMMYLHSQDIVHRDLKPENLLLENDQDNASLKIADFGVAKRLHGGFDAAIVGTPGYIAPEILKHQPYKCEVDMWSIGVICYILLCGYPPFYGTDSRDVTRKIKRGDYQFDEQWWSHVSDQAMDFIRKLLNVDVEARYTAEQALAHPWMMQKPGMLKRRSLAQTQPELKKHLLRRKFRAAITAALATGRLTHIMAISREQVDKEEADAKAAAEKAAAAEAAAAEAAAAEAAAAEPATADAEN